MFIEPLVESAVARQAPDIHLRLGQVTIEDASEGVTNGEEFQMRLRGITPGSASFRR